MKKMKLITLFTIILLLLLVVGCTAAQPDATIAQPDDIVEIENNDIIDTKIQTIIDGLLSGELTDEEFNNLLNDLEDEESWQLLGELRNQLGDEEYSRLLERLVGEARPLTEEELEAQRIRDEVRRNANLEYIIHGNYTPAADDIDLQTIERFVFFDQPFHHTATQGLIIDRTYGRVYYDFWSASTRLEFYEIFTDFIDEDLERLITVIEKSGMRDWEYEYPGSNFGTGRSAWTVGILFEDGTMLRRSGWGMDDAAFPPTEQWEIWTDFINKMEVEITERHREDEQNRNLREITRFQFDYSARGNDYFNESWTVGHTLTFDIAGGQIIYYTWADLREHTSARRIIDSEENEFSAELTDSDLVRLNDMFEQSGLLYWERRYSGTPTLRARRWEDAYLDGTISDEMRQRIFSDGSWSISITMSDGTEIRRSGVGRSRTSAPPTEEFRVLLSFAHSLGQEIIERYNIQ